MALGKTDRGFDYFEFTDIYFNVCSLQKSSLATEDAIWLGINDVKPRIMCSDAIRLGINAPSDVGWVDYPMPPEVLMTTRMHLTREMVAELLPILTKFVETGDIC